MATESFEQKWAREEKERREHGKEHLLSLIPQIKQSKYRYLVAYFDGSGDSGQMETIMLSNEDDVLAARYYGDYTGDEALPAGIDRQELEDAAWELTPPGFENNEGGFGAVILDCQEGKVRLNYSYRVEDSVEQDTPEV